MRRLLVWLAVLLLAQAAYSEEQSKFAADVYLKSAEGYLRSGDYENALRSAYMAKEIYGLLKDDYGSARAERVISDVEALLPPLQLADRYYNIAGGYLLSEDVSLSSLQRCSEMAGRCRDICVRVGGVSGVSCKLKCEDLVQRCSKKIFDTTAQCVREGDDLLGKAQGSFFGGFYTLARSYAVNASEKYISCPYPTGIDNAANLQALINSKIDEFRMNAKASYDKAVQYFAQNTQEDYTRCIEYAAAAQAFYTKIEDTEGYSTATSIASRCQLMIDENTEDSMREAAIYLQEAKSLSLIPDCGNATDRANRAIDIYWRFYHKARATEKDLSPNQQLGMKLYGSHIQEVNLVLGTIRDQCSEKQMLRIAEDFYSKSQEFYLTQSLNEALTYASNARKIFLQYQKYVGVSKCDTLVNQINIRVQQRAEANSYYAAAKDRYRVASFDEALLNANKAKAIYSGILDTNSVAEMDMFIGNVSQGMLRLDDANTKYRLGKNLYDVGRYKDALPPSQTALSLYTLVNYSVGIDESNKLISDVEVKVAEEQQKFINNVILFGAIFMVSAFLIIQFTGRKRAVEAEYRHKIMVENERERRTEEELLIRSEEDTKSKVEDELRKLVESERNKIDDA